MNKKKASWLQHSNKNNNKVNEKRTEVSAPFPLYAAAGAAVATGSVNY